EHRTLNCTCFWTLNINNKTIYIFTHLHQTAHPEANILTQGVRNCSSYPPHAAPWNNDSIAFPQAAMLPQYKLAVCRMSVLFLFHPWFLFVIHSKHIVPCSPCQPENAW